MSAELRANCGRLDRRELDLAGLVALGRELGEILLPPPVRRQYELSFAALDDDEGLRLRLKLDTWGVADLPWEFAWLPSSSAPPPTTVDASGFLALDPRISIVRYEILSAPIGALEPTGRRRLRMVALFAAPQDPRWAPLDLAGEERGLRGALAKRPEIGLEVVSPATLAGLESALLDGAQVFHFAGHGRFQAAVDERIDTVAGRGFLVFCDKEGKAIEVPAETVVVNLHGRGVRLAVLGACEGARRDRFNPWTGIAPALVRGGLPAAVAMQSTLFDRSAIAFSSRFYESLALGQPIDAAVSAGRIAIFNESGPGERDWGVPVLYLRAETGVLFPRPEAAERATVVEPLGRRGWLNAALVAAALAALAAAFHAYVEPRFAERWIRGGGLSAATLAAAALAWLHWLAGDEARSWLRGMLRHARTTLTVGVATLVLAGSAAYFARHRPTVVRLVPGTKVAGLLNREGESYSLRIWQGEEAGEPTWTVARLPQSGAVVGAQGRARQLALARADERIQDEMQLYLAARNIPESPRRQLFERWRGGEPVVGEPDSLPRRRSSPLRVELWRGDEKIETLPLTEEQHKEGEDDVELVFVDRAAER